MFRFLSKKSIFLALFCWISLPVFANENSHEEEHGKEKKFNPGAVIMDHITDSHEWHFFTLKNEDGSEKHVSLPLPVILYSSAHGLQMFSFSHLAHGEMHNGYKLNENHKIESTDGSGFFDFSITKNVAQILLSVTILMLLFFSVAKKYAAGNGAAPKGMQNLLEVIIIFIRDEVAKPMLGKKANKYLPYLLTVFFFIWINNLLGLFPGSANVTGNIAVTLTLSLFTLIIILFSSNKHYWHHLFTAPGAPLGVKFILVPIEVISGLVTKPGALTIRLFANMTAGHLIVLSFLSLIFIFAEMSPFAGAGMSVFSVAFAIFIYFLELLVAVLQAYIFTILSALFISEAIVEPEHH